jgi:LuxR family transcriptional regulator, maltose regulon positive regulatory protein
MLLATKIIPPSIKPTVLARQRLLDAVKNHLDRKLLLVTGGGGYGKTTLLAQLIHQAGLPCVYCTLDEDDGDFIVFFSYLVEGCKRLDRRLVEFSEKLLATGGKGADQYRVFMGTLLNELVEKRKQELYIILDDYHVLPPASPVHQAVDYFIDHMPEQIHVIMATRHDPPLQSLPKWRGRQEVYEIGTEGLKFTAEETTALVREVYRTEVPEAELSRMGKKTEGWATGIQLIMNSATRDGRTVKQTLNGMLSDNQPVFEYFASEIMAGETPETREFLTKAAVLEELTPEACRAVFGTADAARRLRELAERNLFITESGQGQYRMHALFREYVLSSAPVDEGRRQVHRRAGVFYQKNGHKAQALRHLLAAGDHRGVAAILDGTLYGNAGAMSFAPLESILKTIPEGNRAGEAVFPLLDGLVLEERSDFDGALRAYQLAGAGPGGKDDAIVRTLALYCKGKLLQNRGRNDESVKTLEQALRLCPSGGAHRRRGIMSAMIPGLRDMDRLQRYLQVIGQVRKLIRPEDVKTDVTVRSHLANLWFRQGEPRKTLTAFRGLIERVWDSYFPEIGMEYSSFARFALVCGDASWAQKVLEHGWELCRPYDDERSKVPLLHGFGMLHLHRGEWEKAGEYLTQAIQGYQARGYKLIQIDVLNQLCQLHRYQDDTDGAERYLARMRELQQGMDVPILVLAIEQAILCLLQGQTAAAEELLQQLPRDATPRAKRFRFRALLLEAAVRNARGDRRGGMLAFRKALRYSEQKGYEGWLSLELRYGAHLRELVAEWQRSLPKRGPERARFDRLLNRRAESGNQDRTPAVTVTMFGKFAVNGSEGGPGIQRKASRVILAWFLLHPGREADWEEIAAWAWPGRSGKATHTLFQTAIWDIRRSFAQKEPVIVYQQGRYRLAGELNMTTDVERFQELLNRAASEYDEGKKLSLLGQAIELYAGPLLPGLDHQWVKGLRTAYQEKFSAVSINLAVIHQRRGDHEQSLASARRCLQIDPLNEQAHRLVIAGHIAMGNPAKAMEQFTTLKALLKRELKTKPSPETIQLVKDIS